MNYTQLLPSCTAIAMLIKKTTSQVWERCELDSTEQQVKNTPRMVDTHAQNTSLYLPIIIVLRYMYIVATQNLLRH